MADGSRGFGPPSSNREVSENERIGCTVDWLACSLDLRAVVQGRVDDTPDGFVNSCNFGGAAVRELAQVVVDLLLGSGFNVASEVKPGRFYSWRVALEGYAGNMVGLVEVGGPHTVRKDGTPTCRLELTGDGCRVYEGAAEQASDHAKRWSLLADMLGALNARLTRVDLAADDFTGQYPLQWALEAYDAGDFTKRGQKPQAQLIDDCGSRKGKTLYVGSTQSENRLRVYEKGREQGDEASEWVRYECQFKGSNRRELPLEMLLLCDQYLKGAFPVLEFVSGVGEAIRGQVEAVAACVNKAVKALRRQYGPMINAMLIASDGCESTFFRLAMGVSRPKAPRWVKGADSYSSLREAIPN